MQDETDDTVALDPVDSEVPEPAAPGRVDLVRDFIASLPPHDQAILYNTMQYYFLGGRDL